MTVIKKVDNNGKVKVRRFIIDQNGQKKELPRSEDTEERSSEESKDKKVPKHWDDDKSEDVVCYDCCSSIVKPTKRTCSCSLSKVSVEWVDWGWCQDSLSTRLEEPYHCQLSFVHVLGLLKLVGRVAHVKTWQTGSKLRPLSRSIPSSFWPTFGLVTRGLELCFLHF